MWDEYSDNNGRDGEDRMDFRAILRAPDNNTLSPASYGIKAKSKGCLGLQNSRQRTTLRKRTDSSVSLDALSMEYL